MEIFVSAGEASSDIHLAHSIAKLKQAMGSASLKCFGLGGDALLKEGTDLWIHCREFSVGGGPLEILSKWPLRRKLEKQLEERLFHGPKIDGALLVDNGEINLRLAKLLSFFDVPIIYYIPPKVWAWRFSRIEVLAQHADLVLSVLPFEEPIYKEWEIPFQYVGHPLADEVNLNLDENECRKKLGLDASTPVITVMPGSRHNEIKHHVKVFSEAIQIFLADLKSKNQPQPKVLIPVAASLDYQAIKDLFKTSLPEAIVVKQMAHECLRVSRAALVKSGTSTLEAGLFKVPMVLAYQISKSSQWIFNNIVRYKGFVGMINLFLEPDAEAALGFKKEKAIPAIPELILSDCRPELLSKNLLEMYLDGPIREKVLEKLSTTSSLIWGKDHCSPSELVAKACQNIFHSNVFNKNQPNEKLNIEKSI